MASRSLKEQMSLVSSCPVCDICNISSRRSNAGLEDIIEIYILLCKCICVSMCRYLYMSAGDNSDQKTTSDVMELELWALVRF